MAHWVEGWTVPRDFILKVDGVIQDLTGLSVSLLAKDKDGTAITFTGTLAIVSPATQGKIRFSPAATDLTVARSPIAVRWRVRDTSSKDQFHPNEAEDIWLVHRQ